MKIGQIIYWMYENNNKSNYIQVKQKANCRARPTLWKGSASFQHNTKTHCLHGTDCPKLLIQAPDQIGPAAYPVGTAGAA